MKTSARFLAMLLAVVMIASAALSVSAFSDVTGDVEHATAINVLAQLGVIGGYEDGTFKPDQNVTRAEMTKLVYVLYTTFTDAGAGTVKFNDVKADNWAVGYISWCASKGIIGGYGDGNFGPSDNVTYDQALKMVCGALGYNEWDSAQWPTDVRMKALSDLKLGEDMPKTVKGTDKLTRAQVAQIMYNALDADMNETKTEAQPIIPGSDIMVNLPVPKKLAEDVWKFTEVTYTVAGTENYGTKTKDEDKIALTWTAIENGDEVDKSETFEVADLGLDAFAGNTDDLINIQLVGLEKNGERLGNMSLKGAVKDGVSITYTKARTTLTIDGVQYDADDFAADAKYPIALYNINGTKSAIEVFKDEELTTDFTDTILPTQQYLARTIDFDGDAHIDAFVVVAKTAYKVTDIVTLKNVKTVKLATLNGADTLEIAATDVNIEVEEGDVIVAALMGQKLYAVEVEPVETYATRLSASNVTLNNIGAVKYAAKDITVAGAAEVVINTGDLGSENVDTYYIYNGEVILKENVSIDSDYTFAILRDVEKGDKEAVGVTYKEPYFANIIVVEEGKLVVKQLPIDPVVGKDLIKTYAAGVDTESVEGEELVKYTYALVTSYKENKDGFYDIVIGEKLSDSEDFILVPKGATFKYNSKLGLFSVGDTTKVRLDAEKYETGAAEGFVDMKFYTQSSLTTKAFEKRTSDITILAKDPTLDRYTLLATVVDGKIEGTKDGDVASYKNDGRLILFAPEDSQIVIVDGKKYNAYTFMDNAKLETAEEIIDTNKEHDEAVATEAGYLYGYNVDTEVYDVITKDVSLETIKAGKLVDVLVEDNLVQFGATDDDFEKITSDVVIWGLADDEDNNVYTKLTIEELAEMLADVNAYNEELEEGAIELDIDLLLTYYYDSNDDLTLASIIVEIFEADEEDEDILYSVNDVIFKNYLAD